MFYLDNFEGIVFFIFLWTMSWRNCSIYKSYNYIKDLFRKWYLILYSCILRLSSLFNLENFEGRSCAIKQEKIYLFQMCCRILWRIKWINIYFIHNLLTILVLSPVFFPSYFQDTYIIRIRPCISLESLFFLYFSWWVFIRVNIFISYDIHVVSCIYG